MWCSCRCRAGARGRGCRERSHPGKGQTVAGHGPQNRADAYTNQRLRHGGENVLFANHAAIEQGEAGNAHHQHETRGRHHPCGVGGSIAVRAGAARVVSPPASTLAAASPHAPLVRRSVRIIAAPISIRRLHWLGADQHPRARVPSLSLLSCLKIGLQGHNAIPATRIGSPYQRVFSELQRQHAEALLVSNDAVLLAHTDLIIDLVQQARLPALFPYREFVTVGGLIAYAVDAQDMWANAARYADMVLRGTEPSGIPVYQAHKFTTIVNLKTAKAIGLEYHAAATRQR